MSVSDRLRQVLAVIQQSLPMGQATGETGVQFDAARFKWIGSPILLGRCVQL